MKRIALCLLLSATILSCKKEEKPTDTTVITDVETDQKTDPANSDVFDVSKIAVSDKVTGAFPYLTAPNSYTFNYDGIQPKNISELDKEYFAVNGKLIPQQGKTAKFELNKRSGSDSKFSSLAVIKSFDDQIKALGGVSVNEVEVPKSETERIGNTELITKQYGYSLDFNLLDQVKTYLIRTKDKEIWIQFFAMNEESGRMTVLEKAVPAESSDSK